MSFRRSCPHRPPGRGRGRSRQRVRGAGCRSAARGGWCGAPAGSSGPQCGRQHRSSPLVVPGRRRPCGARERHARPRVAMLCRLGRGVARGPSACRGPSLPWCRVAGSGRSRAGGVAWPTPRPRAQGRHDPMPATISDPRPAEDNRRELRPAVAATRRRSETPQARIPPSTGNATPFTYDPSSLARKSAASAMSSGRPTRATGST